MSTDTLTSTSEDFFPKLNGEAADFIRSVLELKPRIATFDCDGTLWSGDAGADFFYWELEQGLISPKVLEWVRRRYDDYKAGRVDEATMCGEMVTIHKGLTDRALEEAAERFFAEVVKPRIFPEMQLLTRQLAESGCELWAVSSTNEWVVRAGTRHFRIPDDHVLAACVHMDGGCASDRLKRVPTDEAKALAIREVIARDIDAAFGNSIHDAAMLELAPRAFAVNPNPDLEQLARERRWTIYHPQKAF